ncbi:N-acetylglucosamine-6-phosphate deacetylase [Yoonia maritima]|uniref:N-acetylglucosamine-6-phosphate deacetylase n=1 Tax=Yoonia maritima TaxID=1435347 RepID=A0A2T0VXJ7_9RHOB|nr:N-acetylglucosamine-6-phosphate deacetylase [Yoonia maritima]PRY76860.1 N-acetylglucosamine-6-phosphate deacetylase [Yoonia maritima]
MTDLTVFHAEQIFDGYDWHRAAALLVADGRVDGIVASVDAPSGIQVKGAIVPGLVDLQVNGGGGVLFNNDLSRSGVEAICAAHAQFGTTSVMVTLITDTVAHTAAAIGAAVDASDVPGWLGLHLEGPHLDRSRKGTHDPDLIRPMNDDDLARLISAKGRLEHMICTVAPESVTVGQVATLSEAGIVVSLGHTGCTHSVARAYADAGARMVTHLFNAMGQLEHRAPNLVGAALDDGRFSAGLIADGYHVDDSAMRIALRGKNGPGNVFLVSDAMSTIRADLTGFTLNGREIFRSDGRLTLADGTLAGADIALIDAVRYVHQSLGLRLGDALNLGGLHPAQAMGINDRGHLKAGARADFFALTPQITADGAWISGQNIRDNA